VTLNPIDDVEQKASSFWDHIHRKFCLLLKQDNPSKALPDRDSESLKNRFQRQIQKKILQASQGVPPFRNHRGGVVQYCSRQLQGCRGLFIPIPPLC
jgi:hypothetical protein